MIWTPERFSVNLLARDKPPVQDAFFGFGTGQSADGLRARQNPWTPSDPPGC